MHSHSPLVGHSCVHRTEICKFKGTVWGSAILHNALPSLPWVKTLLSNQQSQPWQQEGIRKANSTLEGLEHDSRWHTGIPRWSGFNSEGGSPSSKFIGIFKAWRGLWWFYIPSWSTRKEGLRMGQRTRALGCCVGTEENTAVWPWTSYLPTWTPVSLSVKQR